MPQPTKLSLLLMGVLSLSSCETVPIHDMQVCSQLPMNYGAVCDSYLTDNHLVLTESQWVELQNSWMASGQTVECTSSQTIADIKAELEKLCSVTSCSYETKQIIKNLKKALQTHAAQ